MILKTFPIKEYNHGIWYNEVLLNLVYFSNNRIGLLATQKLALGIAAHPNLKVLKVRNVRPHWSDQFWTAMCACRPHQVLRYLL